jgi:hypothetical protein
METKGSYRGTIYESEDELWFLYWAYELYNKTIIHVIDRSVSFSLTEGLDNEFVIVNSRGKEVTKRQTILRPSHYTPEFCIKWSHERHLTKKFVWLEGDGQFTQPFRGDIFGTPRTYIEVKPSFDQNNMTRLFKNNQKFMWDKHKIFVNLVHVKELFEKTFTPAEFLKTRTGKDRKLNYEPRSLEDYLKTS